MKKKRSTIRINKSVSDVFGFVTNPRKTPLWIDSIEVEKTNEWPARLGTVYRNKRKGTDWSEYVMTEFKENERFVMSKRDGISHVMYTLTPVGKNATELEYCQWVDKGELDNPFTVEILEKLKSVIEKEE